MSDDESLLADFFDDDDIEDSEISSPPKFLVCQYCGAIARNAADTDWFVARHKNFPNVWIVRCPEHISSWARRMTK